MDEVRQILHLAGQNRKNGRVFRATMLSRQESPSTSSSSSSSSSLPDDSKYARVAEKHRLREELARLKRQVRNQRRIRKDIEERVRQRIRHAKMSKMADHARLRGYLPSVSMTMARKQTLKALPAPSMELHEHVAHTIAPSLPSSMASLPPIRRSEMENSDEAADRKTSIGLPPHALSDASPSNVNSASMPHIPRLW
eukprot:GEMP01061262.1.p1 GENE.GEMP01061262.1~~GEMP01061262.1.p1  ORF type:complete len:197 (+),score=45.10 GEMP01061262.1:64-654(+)